MKKQLLLFLFSACMTYLQAFTTDTVSVGSGYAQQVWYSLENGIVGTAPKNDWDIAFDASGFGASVFINSITGTKMWKYPNGDTSQWNSIDTSGISTWTALYNSDTSWVTGATDAAADPSNDFDFGWGTYSLITHQVVGDRIFILQLADKSYRKLWVKKLASASFTFVYALLDGTDEHEVLLAKSAFSGKNFAYYNLTSHNSLDREPLSNTWDFVFGQYSTIFPGLGAYTVTGLLQNKTVSIATAYPVDEPETFSDHNSLEFSSQINRIGYDWKTYVSSTNSYSIEDSTVYFAKTASGDIWKIIMTGFGGSADGNMIFKKEKIVSTGIKNNLSTKNNLIKVYPNPAQNGKAFIQITGNSSGNASLLVSDISGRTMFEENLRLESENPAIELETSFWPKGIYLVQVNINGTSYAQKIILQ